MFEYIRYKLIILPFIIFLAILKAHLTKRIIFYLFILYEIIKILNSFLFTYKMSLF
jgi:hypothetical protein